MSTVVPAPVPGHLRALVDDAAIFPPGNSPLPDAVSAHAEHRAAPYAALVGPFVVSDLKLADLHEVVSRRGSAAPQPPEALGVSVVVSGGAGALEPAVRWASGSDALELRGLEITLRGDSGELAHNAKRIVTAVDQLVAAGDLDDTLPVSVEMPRLYDEPPSHGWLAALDEVAAMDHRVKLRTGGVEADAFPTEAELATCIGAVLDREVAFKCTAGLHHALRHRDAETGFEHHGFLNVLLATRTSLDGGSVEDVAAELAQTVPDDVRAGLDQHADLLEATRRWFTSFGSCSVLDPWQDLTDLGLVGTTPTAAPLETTQETR